MTPQPTPDDRFMRDALRLAARVPARPWPNPPVGALVVSDDGRVVGRGAHHGAGTPHAEAIALDEAGDRARGSTLYCTLEPCNHQGRMPPCTPRVVASGIRRLVIGIRDPNPFVAGGGLEVVRAAGIAVSVGVCGEEALELAWPFVVTRGFERPFVALKVASTLDARFAPAGSGPGPVYLTGEIARREVHRMRRWSDLVLVGAGTIAADHPRLDGRLLTADDDCPAADPLPGYVDSDLSEDGGWTGRRHLVFAARRLADPGRVESRRAAGAAVVLLADDASGVDLASLVASLPAMGVHTVLVEGGPSIARSFLAAGLVDRFVQFLAPVVLGAGPTWPSAPAAGPARTSARSCFHLTRADRRGDDLCAVFDRTSFADTLRAVGAEGGA